MLCLPLPTLLYCVTADYVIVGVGTAGAVLAKKLSDDKKTSVVALHNGENLTQDPLIKFSDNAGITVLSALLGELDPSINFLYLSGLTTPQQFADNRDLLWVMATPEGGASSINAGAWARGTKELFSQWEAIAGPEWSVHRILKLYKELENYKGWTTDSKARGYHGRINVRQDPYPSKVSKVFTQAMIEATHLPYVLDYNDPKTPIGISSRFQFTQKGPDGALRVSSATAFLDKHVITPEGFGRHGRKLRVLFDSMVLKVLWEGNTAIGVEYLHKGEIRQVFAKKGVIVCAGLYSSSLLMHSGVGPASLLQSLNIPVIFNNPNVGKGLVDQPQVPLLFTSNPIDFQKHPAGIFSQISWLPAPGGAPNVRQLRLAFANPVPGLTLGLFDLIQPLSRGAITINSSDPTVPPVIDLGFLSNPSDLAVYQSGFQVYIKALNQALQTINPFYKLIFPDPAILNDINATTAFIQSQIRSNQSFQSHCRMAPFDQGGVVDSKGRVYGVQNLFVADDSIVPLCMDGATMASAYLIAANIANMILESIHD